MRVTPSRRLIGAAAAWTGFSALAVVVPELRWAVGPALLVGAAALLADFVLLARTPRLSLERTLPERLEVGREAEIDLVLRNEGADDRRATVVDELPRALAPRDPVFRDVCLRAGDTVRLPVAILPARRGDHPIGEAVVLADSPLGLLRRETRAPGANVRVYPDTTRLLRRDVLHPKAVMEMLGVKQARRRGEGSEFESLREYVCGDDPRHIDWRASARRDHLVTRLYQHERNHRVVIAVDTSRLMGALSGDGDHDDPTKLDHAIEAALALVFAALAFGDRTTLLAFDDGLRASVGPRSRRAQLSHFVDAVSPLGSRLVEADYRGLVRELLTSHRKRSLVVVLTDFAAIDAGELVGPFALLARRHSVLLVALRDCAFDALDQGDSEDDDLHRRIALDDLARERDALLARLRRGGLETLDLVPEQVTAPVLNRFLALRQAAVP